MRMFRVFGVKDGIETLYTTVANESQGKMAFVDLEDEGYEYGRLRDCLGGLRFEYNLKTRQKTA